MSDRKRLCLLLVIMTVVSLVVVAITILLLYNTAFEGQRERLVETAQSQARLIEAIARFDVVHERVDPGSFPEGPSAATLSQIIDAHKHYKGFGETGEFTLGRRVGDQIVFLLRHRHYDLDKPKPVPFDSNLAEPMQCALSGLSGSLVGLDYRGMKVLAAYEPVAELNLGIVAKIDLAEIRAPFMKAGAIAICVTLLVVLAGAALFLRISNPIIRRLEERTAELTSAIEQLEREIEERKQAEEEIEKLSRFPSENPQPVLRVAKGGAILFANEAASPLLNLWGCLVNQKLPDYWCKITLDALNSGSSKDTEVECGNRVFSLTFAPVVETDYVNLYGLDITERKRAEEALHHAHAELEQRVEKRTVELRSVNTQLSQEIEERKRAEKEQTLLWQRLEALWEIASLTDASHQELCDRALTEIIDMTDSHYAFYGFFNESEDVMTLYSWSREALDSCQVIEKPFHYPIARAGLWADAVRERRSLIINDYKAEHPNKTGLPEGHVPLTRILSVPILSHGRIVALAAVANKATDYTDEDARQIDAFATNVQVIIDSQQSQEAVLRSEQELRLLSSQLLTAQEDERGRIARELHDGIGQTLSALKFRIEETLGQMGKAKTRTAPESFELLIPMVQNAVEEVRRIYMDLRPSLLDDLGILATMGWFCREFQKVYSDVQIEREIHIEEREVPESLKIVIYRVLQEAMNNIAKHSEAERVVVTLKENNRTLELAVEDNGIGFDLDEALSVETSRRGFGLGSMRERIELSGGSFAIESVRGKGTIARAIWPT